MGTLRIDVVVSRAADLRHLPPALQTAGLVAATGEWRSEGRGRPAQLFRYAPKKRKVPARGIRF